MTSAPEPTEATGHVVAPASCGPMPGQGMWPMAVGQAIPRKHLIKVGTHGQRYALPTVQPRGQEVLLLPAA